MGVVLFQTLLFSGAGFVKIYFYPLIWWSFILLLDGVYKLKTGRFFLFASIERFSFLFFYSSFYWGIFEAMNFFLKNWAYENIISNCIVRTYGYFISYGSVIPAILLTKKNLEVLIGIKTREYENDLKFKWIYFIFGVIMFILIVLFPRIFFPLTWGFLFFILEPFNKTSIIKEWKKKDFKNTFLLVISGLICGILWEFWNYNATSKWIYTIPVNAGPKIFEMPLAGYVGFMAFAVETEVFYRFISYRFFQNKAIMLVFVLISFLIFKYIDLFTVINFI